MLNFYVFLILEILCAKVILLYDYSKRIEEKVVAYCFSKRHTTASQCVQEQGLKVIALRKETINK